MTALDYSLVCGVDKYHLRQLELVWPTWRKYKPSILEHPMVMFYDYRQTSEARVRAVVDHSNLQTIAWPLGGLEYKTEGNGKQDKWNNPHRAMMISGFVYVPALFVNTPYWLKLDTDVVATGRDDWIDVKWFDEKPAIVSHRWTFTKPADQMLRMDRWVEENSFDMPISVLRTAPLGLRPEPGWDRLRHKRIISWCGFFDTQFSLDVARLTEKPGRKWKLPVASQDGYMWYMATRMERKVIRANMKKLGWEHWSTWSNVERRSKEVMYGNSTDG